MTEASLFVATYEMPRHLELVCSALLRQSAPSFEVIFCDDGSGQETRRIIDAFRARFNGPTKHLWQEHQGFRKCRILNEGLRQSQGETCVFLDGDCVPHRHYVRDHLNAQEKGFYLAGRRVELGAKISSWLTPQAVERGFFDFPHPRLLASALSGDLEFPHRSLRIPWASARSFLGMSRVTDLKGCNYSVPRAILEKINGFDEDYEGYGREDTDVEIRLQHLGLRIKSLKGIALQFHVWHPRRDFTSANDERLEALKRSSRSRCENGWIRAKES